MMEEAVVELENFGDRDPARQHSLIRSNQDSE
jgi:hypothetical protein